MRNLLPLFLDVSGREVLLVGGGPVAAAKLQPLLAAGAVVTVVSPAVVAEIVAAEQTGRVAVVRRPFGPADLDRVWLVVAAATGDVNQQVAAAAQARRVFVNAVDDPVHATAYFTGVVRRGDLTIAISTHGAAPALTSLVREGLDALLPDEVAEWTRTAREQRSAWRRDGVPMHQRKPLLLEALNQAYRRDDALRDSGCATAEDR